MAKETKDQKPSKAYQSMEQGPNNQGRGMGSSKEGSSWKDSSNESGSWKESGNRNDSWKEFPGANMTGGKETETKKGCFPKLLLLLLPLIIISAHLFLRF
jgi:hypothetical protein